jgi:hypothetical protein
MHGGRHDDRLRSARQPVRARLTLQLSRLHQVADAFFDEERIAARARVELVLETRERPILAQEPAQHLGDGARPERGQYEPSRGGVRQVFVDEHERLLRAHLAHEPEQRFEPAPPLLVHLEAMEGAGRRQRAEHREHGYDDVVGAAERHRPAGNFLADDIHVVVPTDVEVPTENLHAGAVEAAATCGGGPALEDERGAELG